MPSKSVYLDYAAASPMDTRVRRVMQPYLSDLFYNPSANYQAAAVVKKAVENARSEVAAILGAKPVEIIFTAGGSEANNLAVSGVMQNYPKCNLIISSIEHPSVSEPAGNYKSRICPVTSDGLVNQDMLAGLIDDQTVLISINYVNNEIGTIQPLKEISKLVVGIRQKRAERGLSLPLYLHTDACQAANYLDLHVARLGVDLMTLNGGKIYGPKQSGALFVKSGTNLSPIIYGGGQERGLRSGSENVAAIVGFSKALDLGQASRKSNSRKLAELQTYFKDQIVNAFPGAIINGSVSYRVVNNLHLTFKGVDNEWLLIKLDDLGVMAAAGSACSAASGKPSSVLAAIGLSDEDARSSVRFSFGNQTSKADLDYALQALKKLLF